MEIDSLRIQELIDRPSESLSVELKRWINPDHPDGIAKIVRAVLALRNHGGGYLVIGFDNRTLQPVKDGIPADVKSAFHLDKVQGLVSRFASEPFEIAVEFREREGRAHPVVIVPSGVKTPVASKSDLVHGDDKLICTDDVFVRSLRSNNTPSTTRAGWKDWPKIVEVCFDNREADIGRFMRRHLSAVSPEMIRELASLIAKERQPEVTTEDLLRGYLREGEERYNQIIKERKATLPDHGAWEIALLILGDVPKHTANTQFINLLDSSNPNYTGWPIWLDSRNFTEISAHPYVVDGIWEAFIVSTRAGWSNHLDFMRLDPNGRFYLRRALQDDFSGGDRAPKPFTALDFGLSVIRTAEAIAVGIAYAKAMGCDPENTVLAFAFRWTRLRGRELTSWVKPERHISGGRHAYQDEVLTCVNIPLDTPLSAIAEFVDQVLQPLFEVFDGFSLGKNVIEDLTRRLVERKL
ncbi:MAG: ATP-binding protein [Candidatus Kerfeldbacteria bacterium]|nr:ATP-binding protein [Candidatus Kerfeldbacteria bacterium]